jgi:hypothetical protein
MWKFGKVNRSPTWNVVSPETMKIQLRMLPLCNAQGQDHRSVGLVEAISGQSNMKRGFS